MLSAKPDKAAAGFTGSYKVSSELELDYEVPPYPEDQELLLRQDEDRDWYFVFTLKTPTRNIATSIALCAFLVSIPFWIIRLMPWGLTAMICGAAFFIVFGLIGSHIAKKYGKAAKEYTAKEYVTKEVMTGEGDLSR